MKKFLLSLMILSVICIYSNSMTNLGFYWADNASAPAEPDWSTLTQKAK